MVKIEITLSEPEAAALRELAEQAGISAEEAAVKCIRHVLKEVSPVNPQFYSQLRSRLFWEHLRHLNAVLRQSKRGEQ